MDLAIKVIKHGDFPWLCESLPEGNWMMIWEYLSLLWGISMGNISMGINNWEY